ncbi:glycosyltransferase [Spirochaeta lutea]|uniref:Glycosyl transferase family 28 C-terminal domain-containing protein n=1 Tax=Spirochaeta lutea TaxID=1480694 RepID=A0A098QUY4_9SPIO|nr:glycosyltransferase [Spirochaeta lutea]KGE71223.1 hypothetical protein DC28_12260 [Spirochaeta lutea]
MKKKIIFAMIEAGGGHKSTALAIAESLQLQSQDTYDIQVLDFARAVGALHFDAEHKKMWQNMLRKPLLTRVGYALQDFFGAIMRFGVLKWAEQFVDAAEKWFLENPVDMFVATHFLNAAVAIEAKRRNPDLTFPIVHFFVEPFHLTSTGFWPEVDLMVVGSERVRDRAVHRGMSADQVILAGYPVRPSFFDIPGDLTALKKDLGIQDTKPTLIISSGAEGQGKLRAFAKALVKADLPLNALVICAKNEELKAELHTWQPSCRTLNLIPLGFVSNMNELIAVSDVVAAKAGPASVFEAVFLKKPVFLFDFVAGHEWENIRFVQRQKVGWFTPSPRGFVRHLKKILKNPHILDDAKTRLEAMEFKNASHAIARILQDYLQKTIFTP